MNSQGVEFDLDNGTDNANDFFANPIVSTDKLTNVTYHNKEQILSILSKYHHEIKRPYKLIKNDGRWVYAKCPDSNCSFHANFNFLHSKFTPPKCAPHSCLSINMEHKENAEKPINLSRLPQVIEWMKIQGWKANTEDLHSLLINLGYDLKYSSIYQTLVNLNNATFVNNDKQYAFLSSYIPILISKNHHALLESDPFNNFTCFAVVYEFGVQAFSFFAMHGLQLDGTFLKTKTHATLLMAGFKDGNNIIRLIAIAIVSSENLANWLWFLSFLQSKLVVMPSFVISDCDKGLLNAIQQVFGPGVYHAYCFRHVMDNLISRFSAEGLCLGCWELAHSVTDHAFAKELTHMTCINKEATAWLAQIGWPRLTSVQSPVCRYKTITSNNIESLNHCLFPFRELPIIELSLGLEKMVAIDHHRCLTNRQKWGSILPWYATKLTEDYATDSY